MKKLSVVLACMSFIPSYYFACDWCNKEEELQQIDIASLQKKHADFEFQNMFEDDKTFLQMLTNVQEGDMDIDMLMSLFKQDTFDAPPTRSVSKNDVVLLHDHGANVAQDVHEDVEEMQDDLPEVRADEGKESEIAVKDLYRNYITVYYPKVYVIIEQYLLAMCPIAADKALGQIVDIYRDMLWFYYQNKPAGFYAGEFWENVIEQCSILMTFVKRARVDFTTNTLFLPGYVSPLEAMAASDSIQLLDYWKQAGKTRVYDFFAFYFDLRLKMFNEGIRFKIYSQATRYKRKLEKSLVDLRGSAYESRYQEAMNKSKELLALLRQRIGIEERLSHVWLDDDDRDSAW